MTKITFFFLLVMIYQGGKQQIPLVSLAFVLLLFESRALAHAERGSTELEQQSFKKFYTPPPHSLRVH